MIPSFDLRAQYQQIKEETLAAVHRVLEGQQFILGPEVKAFETEFAQWNGSSHAVGVANGTDALQLALRALGVTAGDEVICPPFTYMATASAVSLTGARPVFVDIEPETFTLDLRLVEAAITPRTKAIIVVHLYGHPANVSPLADLCKQKGVHLIEDCAQSTGAEWEGQKVGNFGDFGCFSFFPTKNLGGFGDGGMVVSHSSELAQRVRMLRAQGQGKVKYHHDCLGTNSRLDELQAAMLRVKLPRLDGWNRRRREIAASYLKNCHNPAVKMPTEKAGATHVFHQFTVRTSQPEALAQHLEAHSIGTRVYYPISLHLQPAYKFLGHGPGSYPVSEEAQGAVLSLPMFPEMTEEDVNAVCQAVNAYQPAMSVRA